MKFPLLNFEDFTGYVLFLVSIAEFEELKAMTESYVRLFEQDEDMFELLEFSYQTHIEFLHHHQDGEDYIKNVYGDREFNFAEYIEK